MIKAPNCTNKSHQRELKYCTQQPSMLARAFYEQIMRKKDLERDPEKDPERPRESLWPSLWLSDWISLSPALSRSLSVELLQLCKTTPFCRELLRNVKICNFLLRKNLFLTVSQRKLYIYAMSQLRMLYCGLVRSKLYLTMSFPPSLWLPRLT